MHKIADFIDENEIGFQTVKDEILRNNAREIGNITPYFKPLRMRFCVVADYLHEIRRNFKPLRMRFCPCTWCVRSTMYNFKPLRMRFCIPALYVLRSDSVNFKPLRMRFCACALLLVEYKLSISNR